MQDQLNDAISLQIGKLIIENHALRIKLEAAEARLAALQKPPESQGG